MSLTINEIAALSGVSRATVSRYLNNGYVSNEKKERIRQVIEETGYSPSSSAQTLRSKKTNYIGVIIPKINSDSIGQMVAGISEVLSANGYQLLLACTNNEEKEELKYLQLFKENNVDGVILLGTVFTAEHKAVLSEFSVPVVVLAQRLSGHSCVYFDDFHAAYDLGKQYSKKGTYFGILTATERDEAVGKRRKEGLLAAFEDVGISPDTIYTLEASFERKDGYEKAKELFAQHPEIDTLYCATDTLAVGALKYLKEMHRRIPEDVQLIGFGDSAISEITSPALTTVRYYYEEAGKESANILLQKLKKSSHNVKKQLQLEYELISRESTR